MNKFTIYPLDDLDCLILVSLEKEPKRFVEIAGAAEIRDFNLETIRTKVGKLQDRKLIWNNIDQATFMVTAAGIANSRHYGRKAYKFPMPTAVREPNETPIPIKKKKKFTPKSRISKRINSIGKGAIG